MTPPIHNPVDTLLAKGARIPCSHSVFVDPSVNPARIAADIVLHPGCRLSGAHLSIGPGAEIGREGPATVINCQLGSGVKLAGGFFEGSVFLDQVSIGAAAHVRPGCLLEEEATCGHAVGLKQTLLMSFVTTGSLINFCDCAMAGGTSRKNHSEVGSSYVHFNFSPNQDKATPSFMGDVPRGVMLDQPPIFLGGQGGLVGPTRVEYGNVVAAGSIVRKDLPDAGRLVAIKPPVVERAFDAGACPGVDRKSRNNQLYIGNLCALLAWYKHVRATFFARSDHGRACGDAAEGVIQDMIQERLKRAEAWVAITKDSAALGENWKRIRETLETGTFLSAGEPTRARFVTAAGDPDRAASLLDFVASFSAEARRLGSAWLQQIVDAV